MTVQRASERTDDQRVFFLVRLQAVSTGLIEQVGHAFTGGILQPDLDECGSIRKCPVFQARDDVDVSMDTWGCLENDAPRIVAKRIVLPRVRVSGCLAWIMNKGPGLEQPRQHVVTANRRKASAKLGVKRDLEVPTSQCTVQSEHQ
ncbi:hypothetical protein D3C86_1398660 [compost metagenome]